MTIKQTEVMWNDKYNLSLVSNGLRRSETIHHYADAFSHLENVSQDIFKRISERTKDNRDYLNKLLNRIQTVEAQINHLKGSNQAIGVFSAAKYPAPKELKNYQSLFAEIEKSVQNVSHKYHKIKSASNVFTEESLREKQQFYQVPQSKPRTSSSADDSEGLGGLPENCQSISSLLLFNTMENPYKKYSIFDPLGGTAKTRENKQDGGDEQIGAAPSSIINREAMDERVTDNFLYIPDLGDVPEIDVPMDLPELAGVAVDLTFSSDLNEGIAPSLLHNIPDLPIPDDVPAPPPDIAATSSDPAAADIPAPPADIPPPPAGIPPPPPPASIPPPPPVQAAAAPPPPPGIPPPPPPVGIPPPPAPVSGGEAAATSGVPENAGDSRNDLLASIRNAGGIGKATLKSSKERRMEKKKAKDDKAASDKASSSGGGGGGDLMSDLFSKLSMRRKGISGSKSAAPATPPPSSGGGSAMDKISAMIPPPPMAQSTSTTNDDDDDEDWD